VKGTDRALALSIDGPAPARIGSLDPYLAGASAVLEGALNVTCSGASPIGVTDCLNFGSPETDLGAWQLERSIDGIADACRALGIPVVSGNVSLYNETPDGPILPTPVVGTVGLLSDRRDLVPMAWSRGDEVWLLGDAGTDAASLVGTELAWQRGVRGGEPSLDIAATANVVGLLSDLARRRVLRAAHDASVGGVAVALARMAIAAGTGARCALPAPDGLWTAAAFGERVGRVIVAVTPDRAPDLVDAAERHAVPAVRLGTVDGDDLDLEVGAHRVRVAVQRLTEAWRTAF
jgi:phosphoribosylformylglycinamidine synthase